MSNFILATKEQSDHFVSEAKKWFYGKPRSKKIHPHNLFRSTCIYVIAEYYANLDGKTLYTARSK